KKVAKSSDFIVDGIPFTFNWTAQWGPFLPLLPLNIRFDQGDVEEAVKDIVENTISEETLGCKEKDILTEKKAVEIQAELLKAMEGAPEKKRHRDAFGNTIESRVGANIEISTLGPPKLHGDYQQARIVEKTVVRMTKQAKTMAKKLAMEGGEAMNNVLILNKEADVKKNILEIHVGKGLQQVAEHAGRIIAAADNIASKFPTAEGEKDGGKH
ncbi:MAG: hypothetical protein KGH79_00890, partial [Patescibacteria group bacterium]|nr:hypothetical protein [Patescibacteria group bacterium]